MTTLRFERTLVRLDDLKDAAAVDVLEISFSKVVNLDGVEQLHNLKTIRCYYCRLLSDITALAGLTKLTSVTFYSTPRLINYSPLMHVASLEDIQLNGPYRVDSIRPFLKLTRLTHLALSRVKVVDGDYSPIIENSAIQEVFWHGAPFPPPALSEIKRQRPGLLIGGNAVFTNQRAVEPK